MGRTLGSSGQDAPTQEQPGVCAPTEVRGPRLAPVSGSWRLPVPFPQCGRPSLDVGLSGEAP